MSNPVELSPFPGEDDPTDELPAYAKLHRKYAAPLPPETSIEDDVAAEGIEDKDPFDEFPEVPLDRVDLLVPAADGPAADAPTGVAEPVAAPSRKRKR